MAGNTICRLCLEVVPIAYTILKENIKNIIKTLTSIDVTSNDDLPKSCCSKCIFNIYFVENLHDLYIKSDERLHFLMNRDGNLDELLQTKPPILLQSEVSEEQTTFGVTNFNAGDVDIKEEKFDPKDSGLEILIDNHSTVIDDISENSNVDDIFEENDIIYKKDRDLYHCRVCKEDFRGLKLYNKHKGMHTKKTCEVCGVTIRQDYYKTHKMIHKMGQQVCDFCGSVHKTLKSLQVHLFHFHNENKKAYKCGECGESFKYSHRLSNHKRIAHTGFRPHQCDSCGKKIFTLGVLRKHVKLIHLKLKEYRCDYCKKDYSSRYALKVHMRQHTNETPYVCEICSEGFRQTISLKTHMAKHEREKNLEAGEKNS